ncbi:hypothetical protein BG006_011352 [Podila minutissima]|uniref:Uncharacterized protein n=1 Tax=Podila minutissima TaxID=64525 RepID=A0A9P5SU21_9FUNG|nr:hypothetical protein BG006_011352 [Podila minutissima]
MLSIQPHHTDISTEHPSVSGRVFLHIPKLAGKKFHFVSLTLHLRLKEAISWTRQDLDTFESEKQSWAQTVWDKKVQLSFQDHQAEEGDDSFAVVKEPRTGGRLVDVAADEWRWEWLVPVTEHEVRPESFEGSMGTVWYELEAKCLFRWDELGPDGTVESAHPSTQSLDLAMDSRKNSGYALGRVQSGSTLLLKGLEGPTSKAKSLAHAFGKLRMSSKSKKIQHAGDFKVANQHEEFIKNSLKLRSEQAEAYASATTGRSTPAHDEHHNQAPEPLPFLIRKLLKLYFIKPPPNTIVPGPSVPGSFYLPPPSMSLATLPATRRLKAVVPGARIQVQIQIPSLIPIPGYAQTSMLVPDPRKGGLVLAKGHASHQQNTHSFIHQHHLPTHHHAQGQEPDSTYLDNFQVALTVRKVTRRDINKNDALHKRMEGAAAVADGASISPLAVDSGYSTMPPSGATPRSRLLSSNMSDSSLDPGVNPTTFNSSLTIVKGCRKEIRVRKVKCEFWQKETCRIPTPNHSAEGQTRTVKYLLGTAFRYSEKDQEKGNRAHRSSLQLASPQRTPLHQLSGGAVSWDAAVAGSGFGAVSTSVPATQTASSKGDSIGVPLREDSFSTLTTTLSPTLKGSEIQGSQYQTPLSTLVASVVPPRSERKNSNASLISSTPILSSSSPIVSQHQRHPQQQAVTQHQPSRPFMLLIPVPLDSPKLRQSYTWPSAEILASVPSLSHEPVASAMPTSLSPHSAGAGVGGGRSRDATKDLSEMPGMGVFGTTAGPPLASSCDSIVEPFGDIPQHRHHHHPRGSVIPGVLGVTAHTPASGNVVPFAGYNLSAQSPHHGLYPGAPVKTRMEVKHYLNFRLSIDVLEYEGEQERDEDHDLEAMEEEQFQAVKIQQTLSAYGHSYSGSDHAATTTTGSSTASSLFATYPKPVSHTSNICDDSDKPKLGGAISRISLGTVGSSHTLLPSALDVSSSPSGIQQPTPGFLNSTVGLLDMLDSDFDKRDLADHGEASRRSPHRHQQHSRDRSSSQGAFTHSQYSRPSRSNSGSTLSTSPPHASLIGAFYDNEQHQGSTASVGTVLSDHSGQSSSPSGHSNMKPGAFVASALGALKKKASSSGLGAVVSSIAGGTRGAQDATHAYITGTSVPTLPSHLHESPHAHRSSAATVRKLQDFVIRVPITVVVRVDDMSRIGTYYKVDGLESMTVTESNQQDPEDRDYVAKGAHVGQEVPSAATGAVAFSRQRRGSDAVTIQTIEGTGDAESEVDGDEDIVEGQFLP